MYLVEILLPLSDNEGRPFPPDAYSQLRKELSELFGGVTAFSRAPAEGETRSGGREARDDIIVLEVMTRQIDRAWWQRYRKRLEEIFRQDEIVVRATVIERL